MHRFSISSPDLRIDAAKRSKQGQSVHRFSISSLDLRIDAAKRSKQGNPSSPREDGIVPRPGNAGWAGTSDGVAARGFVNGEGPAAQRWEGKHRRCAPVRSPCQQADSDAERRRCPQADSDAETAQTPQADADAETPSTRHKKKSPDSSLNRDSRSAAATYSPTWCSSTIGASELNFSVRDGKRWILTAITAAI